MALAAIVDDLTKLDEPIRAFYVRGDDGKFRLDVEGAEQAPTADAATATRLADLERKKGELERDLHKEREHKKALEAAAGDREKAAADMKAKALEAFKLLGIPVPESGDTTTELSKRLAEIEDGKRKAELTQVAGERDAAKIEAEVIRLLIGAPDLGYALYQARQLPAWSELKVDGGRVQGLDTLTEAAVKAGIIGKGGKPAPKAQGQPPLSGDSVEWRKAKDWKAFLALPWTLQQEAQAKDPEFVKKLEAAHFARA